MSQSQFAKKQRDLARDLRKSSWWQNKIANGCTCYYCGAQLTKTEVTMDHLLPISDGGTSVKNNVVACCKPCNSEKKHLSATEWEIYLKTKRDN